MKKLGHQNDVDVIVNLKIFNGKPGLYCYKTDNEGVAIKFAYLSTDFTTLFVKSKDNSDVFIYKWFDSDLNRQNEAKTAISEVLGEFTIRPIILQSGKQSEKIEAVTYWRPNPENVEIPEELVKCVEEFNLNQSK